MRHYWILLFFTVFLACETPKKDTPYTVSLEINDSTSIPFFLMESKGEYYIINGDEKIDLIVSENADSTVLEHPVFQSFLVFKEIKDSLWGYWYNKEKGRYSIPIVGSRSGKLFRGKDKNTQLAKRYAIIFGQGEDAYPAVGIFHNNEGVVSGTFLTETGDYRYLNGVTRSDSLLLATFDMSHAFLFLAKLNKKKLSGTFYSGNHWKESWTGKADPNAELRDPTKIIDLVDSVAIDFNILGLSNETIDISHALFKDKAMVIQLFGSWCPNCYDESVFLNKIYSGYKDEVEFMGVAFERPSSISESIEKIYKFRTGLSIKYPLAYGGKASKDTAREVFPFLNSVESFPTLLFFDKDHKITAVHSGFNGPGTGREYEITKNQILQELDKITRE